MFAASGSCSIKKGSEAGAIAVGGVVVREGYIPVTTYGHKEALQKTWRWEAVLTSGDLHVWLSLSRQLHFQPVKPTIFLLENTISANRVWCQQLLFISKPSHSHPVGGAITTGTAAKT